MQIECCKWSADAKKLRLGGFAHEGGVFEASNILWERSDLNPDPVSVYLLRYGRWNEGGLVGGDDGHAFEVSFGGQNLNAFGTTGVGQ